MPKRTVIQRVKELENVNDVAEEKAIDDRIITLKEVYERVIVTETLLIQQSGKHERTEKRFTQFAIAIIFFEIVNIVISALLMQLQYLPGAS